MLNSDLQNYEIGIVLSKITPRHPVFVAKKKNVDIPCVGKNVKYNVFLYIAGGNSKWYSHFEKKFGRFLTLT